ERGHTPRHHVPLGRGARRTYGGGEMSVCGVGARFAGLLAARGKINWGWKLSTAACAFSLISDTQKYLARRHPLFPLFMPPPPNAATCWHTLAGSPEWL